jgi:hypothetical protein
MLSTTRTRAALTAMAVVVATLLASCETPPPPPPVVAAPPAPPPITLSSSIVEKASAFRGYMQRAGAIGATFENGDQIQASLKVGVGYEPKQFLSGATAYAAVLALQDPTSSSPIPPTPSASRAATPPPAGSSTRSAPAACSSTPPARP